MESYSEYKNSGIEWIGKIPKTWNQSKIKNIILLNPKSNTMANGNDEGDYPLFTSSSKLKKTSNKFLFNNENIITGTGGIASLHYYNGKYNVSTDCLTFSLKKNYSCKFSFYFLLNQLKIINDLGFWGMGLRHLQREFLYNLNLFYPSLIEQEKIVFFLDNKISKINSLIKNTKKQIDFLKEEEKTLINNLILKGSKKKLKQSCHIIRDGTHNPPDRVDDGIYLLSVRNIINNKFVLIGDDSKISRYHFKELERSFKTRKNDILLAIVGATIGKVAIIPEMEKFTIQRSLAIFRPKQNILNYNFLYYSMKSSYFQSLLWSEVGFSAQPGIYLNSLSNFSIPLPPIEEQKEITEFLDNRTSKIQKLIKNKTELVLRYEEYKKTLINNVVTGKIKVTNG